MSDLYQQVLLEELQNPQNKGVLADADVTFHAMNASCGDDMTVYAKLKGDTLTAISWQGAGCAISQATMSLLTQKVTGKTKQEIVKIRQSDLEELIGIEKISPGRVKCLLLGLNAIQNGLSGHNS